MTIISLFFYVGLVAFAMSALISRFKIPEFKWLDNFIQNFCGVLFIFSGFVKAVDPMGTAFKMEQYFAAFEDTCNGSFLKFMAPLFPLLSQYAIAFSVFMIVLEILLGIMIIIGYKRKLSAWLFFVIMIFFTILTGFTYLTGYVPNDSNFFEFSKWTQFNKNQMRVTDCGCFGDFIKLEPKISFFKDLILMIPAFWFLIRWRKLVLLFTPVIRSALTGMSGVGLILFCFANFVWNEPMIDFRPFKIGVNIREQYEMEQKAMGDVEILAYRIRNKNSGMELEVPYKEYLDSFKRNSAFKASWETLDQIKSEPRIPRTKISDFDILALDGTSAANELLADTFYNLIVLSPKIPYHSTVQEVELIDSLYHQDTVITFNVKGAIEKADIVQKLDTIIRKNVKKNVYVWDESFMNVLQHKLLPLMDSVKSSKVKFRAIFGGLTEEGIEDLKKQAGIQFQCYEADDLLLKTIMRSNPGLLLLKDGKIIHKWHHKQLPTEEDLKNKYLNPEGNKIY